MILSKRPCKSVIYRALKVRGMRTNLDLIFDEFNLFDCRLFAGSGGD